ncbi:putative transmembrane protein YshB [Paraliobacillus quinghaiensis]|uniref:Transmembrane protein YshB n=1 Tax=Paraliobacillus quinghaiensis TaxID=470815 RepID=A0A917TKU1_9BACI|nr:CvpA family protein [Paraliobacillus quinghaiensis]GGM26971.1 putative transmembrane protein YshB [Paraliobacillus quinghaiensis]
MTDIILIVLLILGILRGLKRGFILQAFHLIGFIVAFIVAVLYYDNLSNQLNMWIPYPGLPEGETWAVFLESLPLESAFYNAIAFAILFFVTKIIISIISSMLDFVAELPILHSVNRLLGAVLGLLETYFVMFVILYIAALLPVGFIQEAIEGSSIATLIIDNTPVLSEQIKSLWFEHVITLISN